MTIEKDFIIQEYKRVSHLAELDLDYEELQEEFQDLSQLGASITGTEVSLINLIGAHYQWSISGSGNAAFDTIPREDAVCNYTIQETDFFEVSRLDQDPRFSDKDYVKGENGFKYYYGIPLKMHDKIAVGALCVLSTEETTLSKDQIEKLGIIAGEIVKRLELKLKLKRSEKYADQQERIKERLAHDVRGPISGIVQLLGIAQEEIQSPEELNEILTMTIDSGKNLLNLTEDILNEVTEARQSVKENFTLSSFAEKLSSLYKPQAQSKGVKFSVNHSEEQTWVFSKKDLMPISGNLISNAIKFTPSEGTVAVFLDVEENDQNKKLIIRVTDTGIGMSEEKLQRLTTDEAISENGTEGEKGFGFGLRLVMDLVHKMGGTLEATSIIGDGTKIMVRLPLHRG